jgi:hypothetical protein
MLDPEDYDPPDNRPEPVKPDENGEYTCPVCGNYTGRRTSVEAHITGKSDEDHQGRVGKDYRAPGPENQPILVDSPVGDPDPDPISPSDSSGDDLGGQSSDSNDPEDGPDLSKAIEAGDGSFAGVAAVALIIVTWWIAQQSDNEDTVEDIWNEI